MKSAAERELTRCRHANRLGRIQQTYEGRQGRQAQILTNRLGPKSGWDDAVKLAYVRGLDVCAPFWPARKRR